MIDKKVKGSMYEPYGIHKRVWDKYKKLVETKGYTNKMLKIEFGLTDTQIWFLFDKLLMSKYDYLYCRNKINKSDLQIGLYVHCEDFGRGKIVKLYSENLMSVHFDNHKLPCMCSQDGYTVFDNKKRKITRL